MGTGIFATGGNQGGSTCTERVLVPFLLQKPERSADLRRLYHAII